MQSWVRSVVEGAGHAGVSVLMALENVFPPIPSEAVMPLAGFFAAQGRLSFAGVCVAGTLGALAGALALYGVGAWLGGDRLDRFVGRYGEWLLLSRDDLDRSRDWFDRHGRAAVLFGRMVPGVRSLVSIPAGACSMRIGVFLAWSAPGTAGPWTVALAALGFWMGSEFERLASWIGPAGSIVLVGLAATYLVAVVRRRSARHEREEGEGRGR